MRERVRRLEVALRPGERRPIVTAVTVNADGDEITIATDEVPAGMLLADYEEWATARGRKPFVLRFTEATRRGPMND
jgi:hypothetical protein